MKSIAFWGLWAGLLGIFAVGRASADALTEYTSLSSLTGATSDVSRYTFSGAPSGGLNVYPATGVVFGPGTFTTPGNLPLLFNDGLYGKGVQYIAASPLGFGGNGPASVVASFSAAADVTALAFTLGSVRLGSDIDISVNGTALAPLAVSSAFPTAFFGVTDTSGPISNVTFTVTNFQIAGSRGEMDVINSYATARAGVTAPEMDATSAIGALTLLVGTLVVLRGSKPSESRC